MKRIILIVLILIMAAGMPVKAAGVPVIEDVGPEYYAPQLMETTAYICGTHTADGTPVREGICALKRDWMGKTALVYSAIRTEDGEYRIGSLLGVFEVKDTGFGRDLGDGTGTIQVGRSIDVYRSDMGRAQAWMEQTQGKCFVQILNAVG